MNESLDRLESLFAATLQKPPADRADYLEQACADDPALRERVEALLSAQAAAGSFLEPPASSDIATADVRSVGEGPGTAVGPYKLIQQIGEGGMGTVWMAQQTEPVKRLVAVKLIKAGMDSRQVIARFDAERQALALMDHANIARVLEAGTTGAGRPYFVMDLVKGVPITRYCDEHHLTPRQRLELFIPVCQAVQHAHQKGIIHRDLKPSNVLVAHYDGHPVPKVIDFGVAKATGQSLTEKTLVTGFGAIVGTLEYMSPEQAEINQLDIDTRSDIYSLGVLLYELLTGSTPFTRKDQEKAGMLEMLRVIREQEPSKPSTKLSTAEGLPTLAANRGTEPAKLTRLVRGELDWIVMKALEKDRSRRYETANGFAMDVQRYLADEAVQACPPSAGYRLRKFARRNKRPVLAILSLLVVLVAGIIGTTRGMIRATEAEGVALREARAKAMALREKEAALATATADEMRAKAAQKDAQENLKDALAAVEQMLTRVADNKLVYVPQMEPIRRDLLLDAMGFYKKFLDRQSDDPVLRREAALAYRRVGRIHAQFGQDQDSEKAYRDAIDLFNKLDTSALRDSALLREMVNCHIEFSWTLSALGKGQEVGQISRRAAELADRLDKEVPENRAYVLNARNQWAAVLTVQQPDEAEKILRANLVISSEAYNLETVHRALGELFRGTRRLPQAEEAFRQAAVYAERMVGADPAANWVRAALANDKRSLAGVISANQRPAEAEIHQRSAVLILDKLAIDFPSGPGFRRGLADALIEHAGLLKQVRQTADAEKAHRRAIDLYEKLATDFPTMSSFWQTAFDQRLNLGQFLKEAGKTEDAIRVYQDASSIASNVPADARGRFTRWVTLARIQIDLGRLLATNGKNQDAEAAYREVLAIRDRLEKEFADKAEIRRDLGGIQFDMAEALKKARLTDEMIKTYRMALGHWEKRAAEFPGDTDHRKKLADAHQRLGDLLQGAEAEKEFRKALGILAKLVAETHGERADILETQGHSRRALAYSVWGRGDLNAAEVLLGEALIDFQKLSAAHPEVAAHGHYLADTHRLIGRILVQRNQLPEAEKAYRRSFEIQHERMSRLSDKSVGQSALDSTRLRETADSYLNLGTLLVDTGRQQEAEAIHKQAISDFSRLIDLKPLDADAWHSRGYVRVRLKQDAEAVADLTKAIELKPDHSGAWHLRGHAQQNLGHWKESVADHTRSIELAPEDTQLRICRGRAYGHFEEWQKAAEDLAAALKTPDLDTQCGYEYALLCLHLGRDEDYRRTCARMLDRYGKNAGPDPGHLLAWTCLLAPGAVADRQAVLNLAEKAFAADPGNYENARDLGAALYRAGRFEDAAKRLTEAGAVFNGTKNPRSSIVYNWLFQSMTQYRLGNVAEARERLDKAVKVIDQPPPDGTAIAWNRRLTLELLRREAEELLRKESGAGKQNSEKKPN